MKTIKVMSILIGVVLIFDLFCMGVCVSAGLPFMTTVNYSVSLFNGLLLIWIIFNHIKLVKQREELKAKCEELQEYKDNDERYRNIQYDLDNTHGYYYIEDMTNGYWVVKSSPDCCVFIVKVFNFDPADEDSKATAKSKAEELLNLITEGGTLWQ